MSGRRFSELATRVRTHNESRSWHGWHRHVSLVMMAVALLAVIRHYANAPPLKRRARPRPPALIRWSVQEIRRIAVWLAQRRIQFAHFIAWSLWRRAHQAAARDAHLKRRASADRRRRRRKPSTTNSKQKSHKTQR